MHALIIQIIENFIHKLIIKKILFEKHEGSKAQMGSFLTY